MAIYDFVLEKKKLGTLSEIAEEELKRIMFSETNSVYGMPNEGLNIKKILFEIDFNFIKEFSIFIKNYILDRINYLTSLEVTFQPLRLDYKGQLIEDYQNYEYIKYSIHYAINNEENVIQGVLKEWA